MRESILPRRVLAGMGTPALRLVAAVADNLCERQLQRLSCSTHKRERALDEFLVRGINCSNSRV